MRFCERSVVAVSVFHAEIEQTSATRVIYILSRRRDGGRD